MATESQLAAVKKMLIDQLRLRMEPSEIPDDSPLFGEGLGLDSVDAIELIGAVEQSFGVVISGEEEAQKVFVNLTTLTDHIAEQGGFES